MSQELKNRTKKFALDVIGLCAGLPHLPETRHAIDQLIRVIEFGSGQLPLRVPWEIEG